MGSEQRQALIRAWLDEEGRQRGFEIPMLKTAEQIAGRALLEHVGRAEEHLQRWLEAARMRGMFDPQMIVEAIRLIREANNESES